MKKRKLELYITGELMSALMVGRPAAFDAFLNGAVQAEME